MSEHSVHPEDLATLTTTETEFQAGILLAVLEDAGIQAVSFGAIAAMEPLGRRLTPVVVQVRRRDLERARAVLAQNVAESVDLDWDEVDVGERIDQVPLTAREGMPLLATVGYVCALALIAAMVVGLVTIAVIAMF